MLKKLSITVIVTLALVMTAAGTTLAHDNYTYGTIGYKDSMLNISGAVRFGHFGVEVGAGFRDYPGILDYPCPHSDYTIIEDYYKTYQVGIDLIHYTDLADNVSIYAGAGLYLQGFDTISQSNVTDWVYREFTSFEGRFAYSGGLQVHEDHVGVGIGYHSIRGVNLQVVFTL
jgi:hypothetical protein